MDHPSNTLYIASTSTELKNGWVKIGITDRTATQRIKECNNAAVREPYELLWEVQTPFYKELEVYMHSNFTNQKEWVMLSLDEAKEHISNYISERDVEYRHELAKEDVFDRLKRLSYKPEYETITWEYEQANNFKLYNEDTNEEIEDYSNVSDDTLLYILKSKREDKIKKAQQEKELEDQRNKTLASFGIGIFVIIIIIGFLSTTPLLN